MGVARWPVPGDGSGGGVVGLRNTRREGVWVKSPKPSRRGSVSSTPCEMAAADGAWGWHGGLYQAAAGLWGCETRGEGGLGEKPETEPPWLGSGHAVVIH
jgi:hypothetical protein